MKFKEFFKKLPIINKINNYIIYFGNEIDLLHNEVNDLKSNLSQLNNTILLSRDYCENKLNINKNNKIAVYTAIIGDYDNLIEPTILEKDYFDYYCFTDNKKIKSKKWKIIYFDKNKFSEIKNLDSTKIARFIKTHPHLLLKQYKHSIWVDGNVDFIKSKVEWLEKYLGNKDILIPAHSLRDCIYDEGDSCIKTDKEKEEIVRKQLEKYKKENYPKHNGLAMTNIIYRKHNKKVNKINELWWDEIAKYSKRDQLSLNYVLYKNKYSISVSPLNSFGNEYYNVQSHIK